jgi:hypothetical protein
MMFSFNTVIIDWVLNKLKKVLKAIVTIDSIIFLMLWFNDFAIILIFIQDWKFVIFTYDYKFYFIEWVINLKKVF